MLLQNTFCCFVSKLEFEVEIPSNCQFVCEKFKATLYEITFVEIYDVPVLQVVTITCQLLTNVDTLI